MKIAIFTCDRYVQNTRIVQLHLILLRKFWPDCPFPIEVVGNTITAPDIGVPMILTGEDRGWGIQAQTYFKEQAEPVLMLLEDYLICKPPDTKMIFTCLDVLERNPRVAFVRLVPWPGPEHPSGIDGIGVFDKATAAYLFSLMATIWRPEDMCGLLARVPYSDPWRIEILGTELIRTYPNKVFLGTYDCAIEYRNYVRQMKPVLDVHRWVCETLKVPLETRWVGE